jgi:integrase
VCRLKVDGCAEGVFKVTKGKTAASLRVVPIHPALAELVARRTKGKGPDADLFDEVPEPPAGASYSRSANVSSQFGRYLRDIGVAKVLPGRRRSLVNFHSFRRWFITKAEQAGQPEGTIKSVVGHQRQGMTLGLYSAGPMLAQLRACVESVQLP